MNCSFNLLTEPWIPVVDQNGSRLTLGIRDLLLNAHQLREVAAETPPMTASVLLLLLAVVYRVYAPPDEEAWYRLWQEGKFPASTLEEYFRKWESRFDLFDAEQPFYQDPQLGKRKTDIKNLGGKDLPPKSIKNLLIHIATGETATLFDHSMEEETPSFTPAQAARILLADLAFGLGGMGAASVSADRFYKDAIHGRGMFFWVKEDNLFKSILLNCPAVDYLPPAWVNPTDKPIWESDDPWAQERILPFGFLDFLTWPSRRILVIPQIQEAGLSVIDLFTNPGFGLSEVFLNPFYHFIKREQNGEQKNFLLRFKEDRSLWRDSASILDSNQGELPIAVKWVHNVVMNFHELPKICLQTFGSCTEPGKKKIYFYGGEQFKYPASILENKPLIGQVQIALHEAEGIGYGLKISLRKMAEILLALESDSPEGRKPDAGDVDKLVTHWHAEGVFWGGLETHFYQFLDQLTNDAEQAREDWKNKLKQTAREAFTFAERLAGNSPGALKAAAIAERQLYFQLQKTLQPETEEEKV